jgi:hypothetical protein
VCAGTAARSRTFPDVRDEGTQSESTSKVAHTAPGAPKEHQACEMPPGLVSGAVVVSAPAVLHPVLISFLDPQSPEGAPGRTGPPLLQEAPKLSPPRA